jgi:stress response protein YsnF
MVKRKRPTENIEKGAPESNIVDTASTIDRTDDSSQFTTTNSSYPSSEIVQTIPVVEEDFDLTKKTVIHEATIVKRLATKTEKIEIPVAYEEVYINNKKLKIYDKEEGEGLLSRIKDTIAHSVSASDEDNNIEYHYPPSSLIEPSKDGSKRDSNQKNHDSNFSMKGEAIPLIEGQEKSETEKIVPIWGEEIIVKKRKVKLGEIVIRKRRIIENKKIDIGIKKEKVLVEYPDGLKQELTQSLSTDKSAGRQQTAD